MRHNLFIIMVAIVAIFVGCSERQQPDDYSSEETTPKSADAQPESDTILDTYLPWDSSSSDVETTESGLQIRYIERGQDEANTPMAEDRVTVHYEGRLTDGTMFDSSFARDLPATFGLNQVISGWTEGLQLMREGDEAILFIPSDLAYGATPRPGGVIPPNADLIFRIKLLEVTKAMKSDTDAWAKYTPWDVSNADIRTTESGLGIIELEQGDQGGASPNISQQCVVHYEGRLLDGTVFDSSFARGEPISFAPNQVIPGWTEALTMMKAGDRWLVYLPSALAYGPQGAGPIPPNSDLVFEIAMIKCE